MSRGVAPHAVRRSMNKETQMMLVPQFYLLLLDLSYFPSHIPSQYDPSIQYQKQQTIEDKT